MKNCHQMDDNYIQIDSFPYDRLSGQGAKKGQLFGVTVADTLSGAVGQVATRGVYDLTKKSGDTPGEGALVYWDNTNKYVTTTASGNLLIGCALDAALSGDATVRVRLNGIARADEA